MMGSSPCFFSPTAASSFLKRSESKQLVSSSRRRNNRSFVLRATATVSRGKRAQNNDVLMVDPLEAKRLAAKQMQEIQAKKKLKRQRRIEAVNGAVAIIGLTAGFVMEGYTGNSIPEQLIGYWTAVTSFF